MNADHRFSSSISILVAASLILLITLVQTSVYGQRNYREDEINSIHAALIKSPSEIVEWMAGDVHPPGWRLAADFWVDSFGATEPVTRWSSKLINLLTFALVFQLGRHLLDRRLAFYAMLLLGVYGFASNGMYEFRPYSMLVAVTSALHLVYYPLAAQAEAEADGGLRRLGHRGDLYPLFRRLRLRGALATLADIATVPTQALPRHDYDVGLYWLVVSGLAAIAAFGHARAFFRRLLYGQSEQSVSAGSFSSGGHLWLPGIDESVRAAIVARQSGTADI